MLKYLNTTLKANHGTETVPVYIDDDLYITDKERINYCLNPGAILDKRIFFQKYGKILPPNANYALVLMSEFSLAAHEFCLAETEYLLNEKYDQFSECWDFYRYEFNEETKTIYIPERNTDIDLLLKMDRLCRDLDIRSSKKYGVGHCCYLVTKMFVETMEFIQRRYALLVSCETIDYYIESLVKELKRRLQFITHDQYWETTETIPVTHMVPGIAMDYAVAVAIGMEVRFTDEHGLLVKYNEEYMEELYGVLKEKDGTVWSTFSPLSDSDHTEYAIQTSYQTHNNHIETMVTPEQLRSWPNWNEKYADESVISRYTACASILLNKCEVDKIQNVKMVTIPKMLLSM